MLLDFDEHRLHRRALSVAFKSGPINPIWRSSIPASWRGSSNEAQPGPMLFYPAMKQLTLDLAATSFLGAGIGPKSTRSRAPSSTCRGIGHADPQTLARHADGARRQGTQTHRGYFSEQIRSAAPGAARTCSRSCAAPPMKTRAAVDPGYRRPHELPDEAAHDTLTSSLTSFVAELAAHPEWQVKLRARYRRLASPRRADDIR